MTKNVTITAKFKDQNMPAHVVTLPETLASGEMAAIARDLAGLESISMRKGRTVQVYSPALAFIAEFDLPEESEPGQ